jgi:hypothetical protein
MANANCHQYGQRALAAATQYAASALQSREMRTVDEDSDGLQMDDP